MKACKGAKEALKGDADALNGDGKALKSLEETLKRQCVKERLRLVEYDNMHYW